MEKKYQKTSGLTPFFTSGNSHPGSRTWGLCVARSSDASNKPVCG
jgi:hypothetical protein